jgi:hypothetical protein
MITAPSRVPAKPSTNISMDTAFCCSASTIHVDSRLNRRSADPPESWRQARGSRAWTRTLASRAHTLWCSLLVRSSARAVPRSSRILDSSRHRDRLCIFASRVCGFAFRGLGEWVALAALDAVDRDEIREAHLAGSSHELSVRSGRWKTHRKGGFSSRGRRTAYISASGVGGGGFFITSTPN